MNLEDDPYVQAMLELNKQTQSDVAMLAAIFAMDAISSGRRSRAGVADLFDAAGGDVSHYKTSVLKGMADEIRGGSFRPTLTIIDGGKSDD